MLRLLTIAALALWRAFGARADAWDDTLAEARGQTVYWNAWGGDEQINAYIAWVGEQVAERYGVELVHVKLTDTAEAVAPGGRREGLGPHRRRLGRPDLDQRREFRRDEAAGPAVRPVRGVAAELPPRRHRGQADHARRLHDPDRGLRGALGHGAVRVPLRWRRGRRSRRARSRRCSTGPRRIRAASPIRRRPTSSAAPSSSTS